MSLEDLVADQPGLAAQVCDLELRPVTRYRETMIEAAEIERQAEILGDERLLMRARLIRADADLREGRTEQGGLLARQINAWATGHDDAYLLAASHRVLAQFHYYIGDMAGALTNGVKAVAHLTEDVLPAIRAKHLMTLAIVLGENGSVDSALLRFREALDISLALGDHDQRMMIMGNIARLLVRDGDLPAATTAIAQLRELEAASGIPMDATQLIVVAEADLAKGNFGMVEELLRPLTRGPDDLISTSASLPHALLTLAHAHRLAGRFTEAQTDLDDVRRLAEERGLRATQAEMFEQQAALYAAMDLFREAYDAFVTFHEITIALQSAQRDAQARTLQAVFEATEAREASERFREMAHRDALTGLYNRRFVNDRLPALLGEAASSGRPLAVAIVDLDHFKRINDTLSHDTGDVVLQHVSVLLAESATEPAFVARLGGEEFLVVLPGIDAPEAVRRCELLRARIGSYRWEPITGALPVTASIGVTITGETHLTQTELLACADRNLYAAKRGGRDRVVGGDAPSRGPHL